jgi:pyridoxamine 5'-phosphate oxidase
VCIRTLRCRIISPTVTRHPIDIFRPLYALASQVCDEPDAMVLSTVDEHGQPSGRMVLCKEFDERGFVFYTNLGSAKARALRMRPRASLCFYWAPLQTQVRIEGIAEPVADAEADTYFATRPRESQLGAWASRQSERLVSRSELDQRVAQVQERFAGRSVPRPPFWSGFRVVPQAIEFWTREPARLHVRERYERAGDAWITTLLYP